MTTDVPVPDNSDEAEAALQQQLDAALRRHFVAPQPPPELFDAVEAAVQAEVELEDSVDRSLRRQFAVSPPPPELFDAVRSAVAQAKYAPAKPHASRPVLRVLRSAAAVVVSVGLWLLFIYHQWFQQPASVAAGPSNKASVSDMFDTLVAGGFRPDEMMHHEQQLTQKVLSRHGQLVEVLAPPDDVRMLGFAQMNGMRNTATVLMCRVDDQPVVVFVGHRAFKFGPERFRNRLRVNAFSTNLGHLWALELTPLDEPRVIDLLVSAPEGE